MRKLFKYIIYFLQAYTIQARKAALESAKTWCSTKHTYHWTDAYRQDMRAYQRSYMFTHCDIFARHKLEQEESLRRLKVTKS